MKIAFGSRDIFKRTNILGPERRDIYPRERLNQAPRTNISGPRERERAGLRKGARERIN